jgi:hypothetical protein
LPHWPPSGQVLEAHGPLVSHQAGVEAGVSSMNNNAKFTPTSLSLDGTQSAIVFDADGAVTLYVPHKPDHEDADDGLMALLLCVLMLDDDRLRRLAILKMHSMAASQRDVH